MYSMYMMYIINMINILYNMHIINMYIVDREGDKKEKSICIDYMYMLYVYVCFYLSIIVFLCLTFPINRVK